MYIVSKDVLSTPRHLLRSHAGMSWVDDPLPDVLFMDVSPRERRCLTTSLFLDGRDVQTAHRAFPAFDRALHVSGLATSICLSNFVPSHLYLEYLRSTVQVLDHHVENFSYYERTFEPACDLFSSLERAKVDLPKLQRLMRSSDATQLHELSTFLSRADGLTGPITYDRLSSRTGRLTVAQGPSILTLKKSFRDILVSRYPGGRIISVDYRALEARVMLEELGREVVADDLYEEIGRLVLGGVGRALVKAAVIAVLYGKSDAVLSIELGISRDDAARLSRAIRRFFGTKSIDQKYDPRTRSVRNRFGRFVSVHEERLTTNSYVQSTAVDIALAGFLSMVRARDPLLVVPLFVLHDALILDVAHNADMSFVAAGTTPTGGYRYPVQVSDFA